MLSLFTETGQIRKDRGEDKYFKGSQFFPSAEH